MKNQVKFLLLSLMLLVVASCANDGGSYTYQTKYIAARLGGSVKWSIINVENGEVVAKDAFAGQISPIVHDMFYVVNDDRTIDYYNVADVKHRVNKESYGSATIFSDDGFAVASLKGGQLQVINTKCETVARLANDVTMASSFTDGRAIYSTDMNRQGYIDEKGDTVIAAKYDTANPFVDGLAVVTRNHNDNTVDIVAVDRQGKELFSVPSTQYSLINPYFDNGKLMVQKGDSVVFLDRNGKEVGAPNYLTNKEIQEAGYDGAQITAGGYYVVAKGGKSGLIDSKKQQLIEPKWDMVIDLSADRYVVVSDTLGMVVDQHGQQVGTAKFTSFQQASPDMAQRGYVDINLVVSNVMQLITPNSVCGVFQGSTLMDMNQAVGNDASQFVGQNSLSQTAGPYTFNFFFNNYIATQQPGQAPAFNYDARVQAAGIAIDVHQCPNDTEEKIVSALSSSMGMAGFVYTDNGIFVAETGTAVALGYANGIVSLLYCMDKAAAQPLPRRARK